MKKVEVTVHVTWKYNKKNNTIEQTFEYTDKSYLHNPSYIIHLKFENKIIDCSLKGSNITVKDMIKNDGVIVIKYKVNSFNYNKLKPFFYKVVSTLPDNDGCRFCYFYNKKSSLCRFQNNKYIHNELKNCRFFKQRKLNKT
jgi:hypothetical protein